MSRIACIGSRETPRAVLLWMESAGAEIVRAGHTIVSGNAPGADQAWARGGNSVDPTKIELWLPWGGFEVDAIHVQNTVRCVIAPNEDTVGAFRVCAQLHPRWSTLRPTAQQLLARNVLLIRDCTRVLGYLEAFRRYHRQGGGTSFAFKIARHFDITPLNVANPAIRDAFDGAAINGAIFP